VSYPELVRLLPWGDSDFSPQFAQSATILRLTASSAVAIIRPSAFEIL
jgi:hypothetical protein